MKIGYQALFDFKDAFEAIEFGIEHSFDCVELNQINPSFLPEKYSAVQRERLKNYLFPILIHAPESLSLFNTHRKVLDATLERIYEIIDFGREIDAKGITLHLGSTFTISVGGELIPIHNILQEYRDALQHSLIKLAEYSDKKIKLCIENTAGFRYDFSKEVLKNTLETHNLWLTWDIGHTHKIGKTLAQEDEKFFLNFIEKINEVHLHDNHGEWDEHNVIGTGTIDFKYYFELLKSIDPYFIIEVRPKERALESFEALKKFGS